VAWPPSNARRPPRRRHARWAWLDAPHSIANAPPTIRRKHRHCRSTRARASRNSAAGAHCARVSSYEVQSLAGSSWFLGGPQLGVASATRPVSCPRVKVVRRLVVAEPVTFLKPSTDASCGFNRLLRLARRGHDHPPRRRLDSRIVVRNNLIRNYAQIGLWVRAQEGAGGTAMRTSR
jgi:hypothetical protein